MVSGKEPAYQCRRCGLDAWVGKILEKEMATPSSIFAWEISWTEELGRLQSMGSQRVGHDLANKQQQVISIRLCPCELAKVFSNLWKWCQWHSFNRWHLMVFTLQVIENVWKDSYGPWCLHIPVDCLMVASWWGVQTAESQKTWNEPLLRRNCFLFDIFVSKMTFLPTTDWLPEIQRGSIIYAPCLCSL